MKVKILLKGGQIPQKADGGDWYDIVTAEDADLKEGDIKLIDLGIAIQLPKGTEAIIAPRSSTPLRWGVLQSNSIGIIDNKYCGDGDIWKFQVFATRNVLIKKGTAICQFRIQPNQDATFFQKLRWLFMGKIKFVPVDVLGNKNRGGHGHSDKDKYNITIAE